MNPPRKKTVIGIRESLQCIVGVASGSVEWASVRGQYGNKFEESIAASSKQQARRAPQPMPQPQRAESRSAAAALGKNSPLLRITKGLLVQRCV